MNESNFRDKEYKDKDIIKILNPKQAAFYWINGVKPLDSYPSLRNDTGEPVIVYVFSQSQTKTTGVYKTWCDKKQNTNEQTDKNN